jgi:hypothetical protein
VPRHGPAGVIAPDAQGSPLIPSGARKRRPGTARLGPPSSMPRSTEQGHRIGPRRSFDPARTPKAQAPHLRRRLRLPRTLERLERAPRWDRTSRIMIPDIRNVKRYYGRKSRNAAEVYQTRHCERSEAIQSGASDWIASSATPPRNDEQVLTPSGFGPGSRTCGARPG